MVQTTATDLRRFFAALSDEERLAIAGMLALRPATVQDLAAELRIKDGAVQRHLTLLVDTGIARMERGDGQAVYRLDVDGLRAQRKALLSRVHVPSPADEPGTSEQERAVLAAFFDGERLKEIPVNLRKRMVVLAWLAERFDRGERYSERQVNEIITRHYPDYAALRRELVDQGFMLRENGVYWRVDEPQQ
jgi:hypothetical protein